MDGRLELTKFAWRLVVASEVFYIACLLYGLLLTGAARDLHHSLFNLFLGFSWTPGGILLGAIQMAVLAWIGAWAFVWLHNYSTSHRPAAS